MFRIRVTTLVLKQVAQRHHRRNDKRLDQHSQTHQMQIAHQDSPLTTKTNRLHETLSIQLQSLRITPIVCYRI